MTRIRNAGSVFLQDSVGRDAALDHQSLDDLAFRKVRSRRDAAAHDRPAKETLTPEPAGFVHPMRDVLARAKHEQEIGGLDARADQMRGIDLGNFGVGRQAGRILHESPPVAA
jgi:hypothetical protein